MSAQETSQINEENYDQYEGIDGEEPRGPPQACLFVASLPSEVSEESLKEFFTLEGKIEPLKIKIMRDRTDRLKTYAFIQYGETEHANEATLMANSRTFDGKKVRVERAKVNRTLFIAKMEKNITSVQLRAMVEIYGPVDNVTIIKNHHTNKSKGCGFIKFLYREHATNAYNGLKSTQKRWIIEWATSNNDPETLGIDRNNIFVGGLNPNITKEDVEKHFGAHGKIDSISLVNKELEPITDEESGEIVPRSAFAFIRYAEPTSSALAIEQENGVEWNERRIRVQYCESQEMKNKRRANKYFSSMAQYSAYYPAMNVHGMPVNYPPQFMGYPMVHNPAMMYPQQSWIYPNIQVRGEMPPPIHNMGGSPPLPVHHSNGGNNFHSNVGDNGMRGNMNAAGKMNVNTLPYQPQMQFQPQLMHYQQMANYEHQDLDHESSALVNSLTAVNLDRAPRW